MVAAASSWSTRRRVRGGAVEEHTVARALSFLCECGWVTFTQTRGNDGAFSAGRYVIALLADVSTVVASTTAFPLTSRTTHRVTHASVEQLALLPIEKARSCMA